MSSIFPSRNLIGRMLTPVLSPVLALVLCLFVTALPARAVTLLRDPDIEHALRQMAAPVLRAAGLGGNIRVLVVKDSRLNAFVVDSQHIFIHSGMLLKLTSAAQLQAVIAHEAAHIANGHIARRLTNLGTARNAAGLGIALAMAVAAAGADSSAAAGIAFGASSSAHRRFLAHTRAEEAAADQSGVRYMVNSGVDPQGAVELQQLFRGQESLSAARRDPYTRSHPLTRDRVRALKAFVATYKGKTSPDPAAAYWFARAKGKLSAFIRNPKWTLMRAKEGPTQDIRLMREAVAYHRRSDRSRALKAINAAIGLRPKDPFYHELKGQILLESRQFGAAVGAYKRAVALAPYDALILGGQGRALLAAGQPKAAHPVLEKARARDFRDTRVLRDLAAAYARNGQNGMASAVTAERYALQGRLKDAGIHANRAMGLLPRGSAAWRRSQDISLAAQAAEKRR